MLGKKLEEELEEDGGCDLFEGQWDRDFDCCFKSWVRRVLVGRMEQLVLRSLTKSSCTPDLLKNTDSSLCFHVLIL